MGTIELIDRYADVDDFVISDATKIKLEFETLKGATCKGGKPLDFSERRKSDESPSIAPLQNQTYTLTE